jgi:hypothetical protein
MTHEEFREAMTKALVAEGGTFIASEPDDPWNRTEVEFPHWTAFLTTDGDPDWNDDEDFTFDLAVYFQYIISTSFEEANAAVSGLLPEGWILETAGEAVPGCWLATTIDFDRREDVQGIIDGFVKGCNIVHERIGAWPNVPKIERLI